MKAFDLVLRRAGRGIDAPAAAGVKYEDKCQRGKDGYPAMEMHEDSSFQELLKNAREPLAAQDRMPATAST
jgi:hypothetical protein